MDTFSDILMLCQQLGLNILRKRTDGISIERKPEAVYTGSSLDQG